MFVDQIINMTASLSISQKGGYYQELLLEITVWKNEPALYKKREW